MGKRVTIQHIADYLGVSKYVVSRALAGKSGVKDETRDRVIEAAKKLGYNSSDQHTTFFSFSQQDAVTKNEKRNVLVVLPRSHYQESIYWGKIIDGISSGISYYTLGMVIMTETDQFANVINVDGFVGIISVGKIASPVLMELKKWKVPIVLIDFEDPLLTTDTIFANNYDSSFQLTNYLIGLGHKQIKFIGNIHYSRSFHDRWLGYRSAMECHQLLDHSSELPIQGDTIEAMYETINIWLQTMPPVTALVCANDSLALFVISKLKERNVKVPEEISVTGFDNIENSYLSNPTLTTIHVPKEQIGKHAVKLLVDQVNGNKDYFEKVLLTCELIIRNSTAKVYQ
ncbi:LacI family DNA-binding transcriptional regulator [Bacillus weihaiensis]|uniref:HTH lacI-type domain-containing protein n=1 Tax=Bacillus weihaiensis TaxID=1547283 RepID=A0A1L3MRB4_9BACI|nr:LacI family DNA-binding transcriptional regulator [Bacillus weihaiensis]APH04794.1 hypothetical protein A9C19_08565 [Bacillus weihaiensis]